jgi:sulfur carrier protein
MPNRMERSHFIAGRPNWLHIQCKAKVKYAFVCTVSITLIQLTINGNSQDFQQPALTMSELVSTLGLQGKRLAIECNGEIVPRGLFSQMQLHSGDKLEIVGAVGGG